MEPNFFADPHAFGHKLLLQSSTECEKEHLHKGEMEAKKPAGAVPHQQIVCNNEKKETRAMAMAAMASSSPTHSSAEDIFSDTMELASYLHRRVQEIGKQFCHRPFRINTSKKLESTPEFLQGLSRASEPPLASAIAKACCEPGEFAIARENTENCLREGERAPPLSENKPSLVSCFSNTDLSVRAEMKDCMIFDIYDNGFGREMAFNTEKKTNHLYNSRPNDGTDHNTEELLLTRREEIFPFSSENACESAQRKGEDAPSKYREGKLPNFSETACVSMCRERGFHIQESLMWEKSLKHLSDVSFTGFKETENPNMCLDAGRCRALGCTEGKNPRSRCLTPSHDSSEHLLCHASSDMNITEHFSSDLKLPSLQDHAISDAEEAGGFPHLQIAEKDFKHPEHRIEGNYMTCHACLQGGPTPESVGEQVSIHTEIMHSQAVAENSSSPHFNVRHSMSSVDSSECDNCGNDGDKEFTLLRISNGSDVNKSEEIDAMSEAMHPGTHRKEDKDGKLAAVGSDTSGKAESENDALDLLLDAIQVTSAEGLAAKEGADACRPASSHLMMHAPRRNGNKFPEKKQLSLAKMFQTTKKVDDQACLSERVHGSMHPGTNSSHRIQDMLKWSSPDVLSDIPSLHVGSFAIVRKRSKRFPKTLATTEPSGDLVSPVVRFRSLQAVSEINFPNNRKGGKKLAANKLDEQVDRGETLDSSQSCLHGKRERTWENQQDILAKEDQFHKQEKRGKVTSRDDMCKDRSKEQLPATPASEGEQQEQGMLSRRARLQVLPTKFSDSVLQPWKKGDRRKS